MSDKMEFLDLMERAETQRQARRNFIRLCGGAAAMTGGLSLLAACDDDDDDGPFPPPPPPGPGPSPTPPALTDQDVLNFALQLEYLEGNYYSYAVSGQGIPAALQTGTGAQGNVVTGTGPGAARQVSFTDPVVQQYAREIAFDEIGHITFLRGALGSAATAQPVTNLSGSATVTVGNATPVGAFTDVARAVGIVGRNAIFDPFANDENFLIGSYLLTDVGVSAYRGAARLITNKTFLEASAGILATECYHDATIRAELWRRGLTAPTIYSVIAQISAGRDALDGSFDLDQDIGNAAVANLVPTDPGGLVLGRTGRQVLIVVYLNPAATQGGGFFPSGVNGTIRDSGGP